MALSHEAAPTAAPRRRRPRGRIIAADRVVGLDMRSHEGRAYRRFFQAALEEFPGCEPSRIAQVVRLRLLAAQGEAAALSGRGSADGAIRLANVATRAAHALHLTAKGSPVASGANALSDYLASLADQQDEPIEPEVEREAAETAP
jgi:hypothetical protein